MNDPAPTDVADALEQFRLASHRSDAARARIRASIEAQIVRTPVVPTHVASRFGLAGKLASSVLVVGAIWGVTHWTSRSPTRPRVPSSPILIPPEPAQAPRVTAPSIVAPTPPVATLPAIVLPAAAPVAAPSRAAHAAVPHAILADVDPLASEELQLVRASQQAIASGAPARAMVLLDAYAANHHGGVYLEERRAAHAMAQCSLSRGTDAQTEALAFLRAFTSSPSAPRVRSMCGIAEPSTPP